MLTDLYFNAGTRRSNENSGRDPQHPAEHLTQYKEVAKHSLELQQQAVARQEELGKVYMRVVLAGAGLITFVVILIFYLLAKLR